MKIIYKILGFTLLFYMSSFAQQKKNLVYGRIVDSSGEPVPYVSIVFNNQTNKNLSDAGMTDDKGNFSLNLVADQYLVEIDALGFEKRIVSQNIVSAGDLGVIKLEGTKEQNFAKDKTHNIQEITIVAQAKPYKVELDKKVYNPSQDLVSKGGTLHDILSNVPSVSVDTDGTVSMRGNDNVKFLINGKPSSMLGIDDDENALKSIPADQIDRIEVITNPSSKFEASGTSGILNIILKKNAKVGFNSSIIANIGYYPRASLNTNFSWRKNSWTWFVNGGGGYRETKGKSKTEIIYKSLIPPTNPTQEVLEYQSQNSESNNYSNNYNINGGFVYDISDKTSFNFSTMIRNFDGNNSEVLSLNDRFLISSGIKNVFGKRLSKGEFNNFAAQADAGVDHKFNDEGHKIFLSLSLQKSERNNSSKIEETLTSEGISTDDTSIKSSNQTLIAKADYELPIGEDAKVEAGYRIDVNKNNHESIVASTRNDPFITNYNNENEYQEIFNSFYIQFKNKLGDFSYQLGLRNEISNVDVDYRNSNKSIDNNKTYNDLFPSIFLSYEIFEGNRFLLNYSRRINRPRAFFMIPFANYTNRKNIFEGNMDLNPSYSNLFEFGYSMESRKLNITPTLYYNLTTDNINMLVYRLDEKEDVFFTKPINIGNRKSYGLDLNLSYDVLSWLKVMGSVNMFGYKNSGIKYYSAKDQNGNEVSRSMAFEGDGFSSNARLNTTFRFSRTLNMQLQGFYRGGLKTNNQKRADLYSLNLGMSKTFWKGNGTLSLNVRDVLDSLSREIFNFNEAYDRRSYNQWQTRQVSVSFSYRFRKGEKVEQPKKKREINNNIDDEGEIY